MGGIDGGDSDSFQTWRRQLLRRAVVQCRLETRRVFALRVASSQVRAIVKDLVGRRGPSSSNERLVAGSSKPGGPGFEYRLGLFWL